VANRRATPARATTARPKSVVTCPGLAASPMKRMLVYSSGRANIACAGSVAPVPPSAKAAASSAALRVERTARRAAPARPP
jgi:hypothetical protein